MILRNSSRLAGLLCVATLLFGEPVNKANGQVNPLASNGQIVFTSDRDDVSDDNRELYALVLDDKKLLRLTKHSGFDGFADFSSDGRQITFYSNRDGTLQIYQMKFGGTELARLTNGEDMNIVPAFGDGGKRIVFNSNRNGNVFRIYLMNADGSRQSQVAEVEGDEPRLSPNGQQIVFSKAEGRRGGRNSVYIMNSDGTGVRRLSLGTSPHFSPRGDKIVYLVSNNISTEIYTMNSDGTGTKLLSRKGASDKDAEFSPDGSQIVFASAPSFRNARAEYFARKHDSYGASDIYVMDSDGQRATRVTFDPSNNVTPTWGRTPGKTFVPVFLPTAPPLSIEPSAMLPSTVLRESVPIQYRGEVISTFNDLQSPPYSSFLTARNLNVADQQQSVEDVKAYRILGLEGEDGDLVFDPQFSPDGKSVLVKIGDPQVRPMNPYDSYHLYLWNRITNDWKQVTSEKIFVRFSSFSPDGNHIAYISGDKGQDAEGYNEEEPLQLMVTDRRTGKAQKVVENNTIVGNVTWSGPDTLLYAALTEEQQKLWRRQQSQPATKVKQLAVRPDIYEYSLKAGRARLLIKDGQHPMTSPDGQWIAFFGSESVDKPFTLNEDWQTHPGATSLSVVRVDGTERKALDRQSGPYPTLIWRPDNQHFLTLKSLPDDPQSLEVKDWNIQTGKWKHVATLSAVPLPTKEDAKNEQSEMKFEVLGVSKDNRFLWVSATERVGQTAAREQSPPVTMLQAVDLQTGTVTTVARVEGNSGLAWHE